jgi:8-oxo-dGTP pyrophosphatase MutT (NUDIX family)
VSGFRLVGETALHRGHVIDLVRTDHEAPDGTAFHREVVRHPGAVSVVPVHDDGDVVLVRQYRATVDEMVLEIPAGKRDMVDEPLEATARRELVEEVGLVAGRVELLARFHNSIGFCDEESFVFLGTELTETEPDRQGIEESYLEVVRMPLVRTREMIAAGEITDAKTVIGLTFALERIG